MKLLGNCGYGKTVTNKEKFRKIIYSTDDAKTDRCLNDPHFMGMSELSDTCHEITMNKAAIKFDLPHHLGFFVYQYAKLKMLEFYYNFIDKYLDRTDFQYIEMDTDSAYIALSGPSLESLVKPELRSEFFHSLDKWLPAASCDAHRAAFIATKISGATPWVSKGSCCDAKALSDKRTPGLFKVEWAGEGMVALCSKTYYGWGATTGDKLSCKGVSKRLNHYHRDTFLDVLNTKEVIPGKNIGFKLRDHHMYTYVQHRDALSYFYPKRRVLEDGVSTGPILIEFTTRTIIPHSVLHVSPC